MAFVRVAPAPVPSRGAMDGRAVTTRVCVNRERELPPFGAFTREISRVLCSLFGREATYLPRENRQWRFHGVGDGSDRPLDLFILPSPRKSFDNSNEISSNLI